MGGSRARVSLCRIVLRVLVAVCFLICILPAAAAEVDLVQRLVQQPHCIFKYKSHEQTVIVMGPDGAAELIVAEGVLPEMLDRLRSYGVFDHGPGPVPAPTLFCCAKCVSKVSG